MRQVENVCGKINPHEIRVTRIEVWKNLEWNAFEEVWCYPNIKRENIFSIRNDNTKSRSGLEL